MDINTLKQQQELLTAQLRIASLKVESLSDKLQKVTSAIQETCPHDAVEQTSSYHGGGYDYCAETFYKTTCKDCGKVIKTWSKTHHGIYG